MQNCGRIAAMLATTIVVTTVMGCVSWRSKLRTDHYLDACVLADEEIGDDGLHRAALSRISREYAGDRDQSVIVETVNEFAKSELKQALDPTHYRVVRVRSAARVRLAAIQDDGHVWLPFSPERSRAGAIYAVGLRGVDRPSPLAQSMAEAADRAARRATRGQVDPKLRKRDFGVLPECPRGVGECKARRAAFRALEAMIQPPDCAAQTDEVAGSTEECERFVLVQRAWETLADPTARVLVERDFGQCAVSHYSDVALGTAQPLSGDWMALDPSLGRCTLDRFATERCRPSLPVDR